MNLIITLKNGPPLTVKKATQKDFLMLVEAMSSFARYFTLNDQLWCRKSEICSILLEIEDEEQK